MIITIMGNGILSMDTLQAWAVLKTLMGNWGNQMMNIYFLFPVIAGIHPIISLIFIK
jgi:hypothetical protein